MLSFFQIDSNLLDDKRQQAWAVRPSVKPYPAGSIGFRFGRKTQADRIPGLPVKLILSQHISYQFAFEDTVFPIMVETPDQPQINCYRQVQR